MMRETLAMDVNDRIKRWNETRKDYPLDRCLHHFIEDQVKKTPDLPAVTFLGQPLSYKALNERANQLAHYLIDLGAGPEVVIGVAAFRSHELLIGLLAILKSGSAYIPIDPSYPKKRVAFMIEDSKVPMMLLQKSCAPLIEGTSVKGVIFEDIEKTLDEYSNENPEVGVTSENLAYVIYTSGSTGNPKGVMNTHKAIVNRLMWMQETFQIGPSDTLIQKTPFSFDVSVWEFFWPFMTGARLVMAKPEGHKDASYLQEVIEKEGVTLIHFVPSMLHLFLDVSDQKCCRSLKDVVLSGEALTPDLKKRYFETLDASLHNLYGPTEAAVDVSYYQCDPKTDEKSVPIGRPISNTTLYILDKTGNPLSVGDKGELHIGGVQVARGYLNRPELTREKFIPDPFTTDKGGRLYKTGDTCRYRKDGNIEYLGRIDFQVKIRGNRIELGEIEGALQQAQSVQQCTVIVREDTVGDQRLVAYLVETEKGGFSISAIRENLKKTLPDYMIPALFVVLKALPLSPNGKVDRSRLPKPGRERPALSIRYIAPKTKTEKTMAGVWGEILKLDGVGIEDNFFDLGGDSLLALKVCSALSGIMKLKLPVVKLFEYPTVFKLSGYLDDPQKAHAYFNEVGERALRQRIGRFQNDASADGVAIIGMAGKFPGAETIDQLWENLCGGVESITHFSLDELGDGVEEELLNDPDYVPARGIIENADHFDAAFFGIGPLEARLMDPQQRVFLELSVAALENAAYDPEVFDGLIGVYAGVGDNHYYPHNVLAHPKLVNTVGKAIVGYGNEKDYIATRISYALNLKGPSVSANTGCSTSLLSVDNAFRALVDYECDMALAGGIDIFVPQKSGFLYQKGGVFSKDGHCRPFDKDATGTMFCDGAGIVVLKRLSEARADGDKIYAVILGSAKNNDGANKISFLAPSVEGQARVIAQAHANANVTPVDISYIEAHGTGTPIGDPIEIEALTNVFRHNTQKRQFCRIGSVKGHIGHPTIASGVAGLIKATLSLYHEKIPPTLHFKTPNSKIDFEKSPFKVVDRLTPFKRSEKPRIAGVSSFGFGGTNVHTILSEAPELPKSGPSRSLQLLILSAKSNSALHRMGEQLAGFLSKASDLNLGDMAYTLKMGRGSYAHRQFLVVKDRADAISMLQKPDSTRSQQRICHEQHPDIVFLFPGQGAQYVNMGKNFYETEPLFRKTVDRCAEILKSHLQCDLRDFLYPEPSDMETAAESLENTFYTQPAIFTIEYALATLLQSYGITPKAMMGHSVGEFVCATLSGVFSLEDALFLVARRGHLISELPKGSMLSVRCAGEKLEKLMPGDIQLAAVNSPMLCVVSGPDASIDGFITVLEEKNIPQKKLHTSHAFHSAMMDPIVELFIDEVRKIDLHPPRIPFVSTLKAEWIKDTDATDPSYWGRHLRMPVRFSEGIRCLLEDEAPVFLEVGPRSTCTTLTLQHGGPRRKIAVSPTMSDTHADDREWTALLTALGFLWSYGMAPDWSSFYKNERRHRIPLPTYPFEPTSYWVDYIPRNAPLAEEPLEAYDLDDENTPENADGVIMQTDSLTRHLISCFEETSGLDLKEVDSKTTFLEMGMDSLLLSQVAYKLKTDFGVRVVFSQLMRELSTITLLSDYLKSHLESKKKKGPAGIRTVQTKQSEPFPWTPLTLPQKGLWLSSKLSRSLSCAYNESMTLSLKGEINLRLLELSLIGLVQKHDALRARFLDDGSRMRISDEPRFDLEKIDLSDLDNKRQKKAFKMICESDAATPFDLEKGPLFRSFLIIKGKDAVDVILTSHHIVCDGWSLDVLISDLCMGYNALKRGEDLYDGSPALFSKYCRVSVQRRDESDFDKARDYWNHRFKDQFPVLKLPYSAMSPNKGAYDARRKDLKFDGEMVRRIRAHSKKRGWSLFTLFVSAYNILIYEISGQSDFVVGLPIAEQPLVGEPDLVGHCVNLLPFHCSFDGIKTYDDYAGAVHETLLLAYEHQIYTYIDLLDDSLIPLNHTGSSPLPSGLTTVKKYTAEELSLDGASLTYFANPRGFESFDLYFNVIESKDELEVTCHFKTGRFKPSDILLWLKRFGEILDQMSLAPGEKLKTVLPQNRVRKQAVFKTEPTVLSLKRNLPVDDRLIGIWQKVLGKSDISPGDNFFQLGGHSLLAAHLFAEIEHVTGKRLPLSALFEAPTILQMSTYLQSDTYEKGWHSLVPISIGGTRPPIYLIHGAEGNILLYRELAHHLGQDQPVFGLQSRGLDNPDEIDANFERVAENYIKEIRMHQPHGPYFIGGYCLGGTLALEMAQQLKREGEKIGLLFMIENYNIKTIQWPMPVSLNLTNKWLNVWYHMGNLFSEENTDKKAFFKKKAMTEIQRFKLSFQVSVSKLYEKMGRESCLNFPHTKVDEAYDEALALYTPQIYEGEMVLFGSQKRLAGFEDPHYGWKHIAKKGIRVYDLPIKPKGSLSEPYVGMLSEKLKKEVDDALNSCEESHSPCCCMSEISEVLKA